MAVIVLTKDPFVEAEAQLIFDPQFEQVNIRRPFFGISLKDPRHAFLSMHQDGGSGSLIPISMKDSSAPGGWSNANHNFILTGVQESRQERVQIIETFGDHFAFFYGEKPIVLAVQGILLNTIDFNWKNEFWYNYNRFLRGTKCVENKARVFMGYDDVLVQGYVLNAQTAHSNETPYIIPFSFSILLTKEPLDLSSAGSDFVGEAGFNSYVSQAAEARSFVSNGSPTGVLAEYIGTLSGSDGTMENLKYVINPLTGDSEIDQSFSPNVPDAIDNPRSAFWLSESNPRKRQWRTANEALLEMNTKIAAQQAGTDEVTARQALRSAPESFQLGSRTSAVESISKSLILGISNSAAVISDDPGI